MLAIQWGCEHFDNVLKDYVDKVLTQDEFRQKVREVENDVRGTEAEPMTRRLLAAATQMDLGAIEQATSELVQLCIRYLGYDVE